ncbi:hypothetical protein EUGRSUZ_F04104 [Eucalyptus grandis]|uniref:Uncharacterized protein n=2 Tax=Eucalyptus grandis TaxID=71139 RepID=A0ACC3KPB4_EUCGR|nr:hypothetical protein EUGRSUZ_F04104 [Eucalyptus grandis]
MSLSAPALCSSADSIASCLTQHNVNNFTTFPATENESARYYELLNSSIHNLRFSGPAVPKPVAIIFPGSVEQLKSSIVCCREGAWEIRVRSGGHSYEGTSWVATDGAPFVVVDMMNLNGVRVDLDTMTAWVEGGATLGETYYAIAEASDVHGFSAGSCPTVGVGGHISGGGFGLLSRKYGLAADNVVDALLVDSRGRLLDRKAMGEDVFWAIRGGGGGLWGIIYAWKIKLLNVPRKVTGFIMRTIGISATFKGFFLGPRTEAVSLLNRKFPELGIEEEDCKEMSWIESILFFSGLGDGSTILDLKNRFIDYKYYKAKSDYVRSPISLSGILEALDILEAEPKGYVILDPYGGIMHKISGESIAFPHREGNLFTIQYLVEWHENDNEVRDGYLNWIRGFHDSMAAHVSSGPRAAYVNYMDLDLGVTGLIDPSAGKDDAVEIARAWGEKYFLGNYERLVRAKTKIDPLNVFRNQQGIPPMPPGGGARAGRLDAAK